MKRTFTKEFKAKVALEAIKGDKTLQELTSIPIYMKFIQIKLCIGRNIFWKEHRIYLKNQVKKIIQKRIFQKQ